MPFNQRKGKKKIHKIVSSGFILRKRKFMSCYLNMDFKAILNNSMRSRFTKARGDFNGNFRIKKLKVLLSV